MWMITPKKPWAERLLQMPNSKKSVSCLINISILKVIISFLFWTSIGKIILSLKHYENPWKSTKDNFWILGYAFFVCDVFIENVANSKLIVTLVIKEPFSFYIFWGVLSSSFLSLGKRGDFNGLFLEFERHTLMNYNYMMVSWELFFGCHFQLIFFKNLTFILVFIFPIPL